GKVERDKERHGYERLRAFWARMNGEGVPKRKAKDAAEPEKPAERASDPSDRIIVDREELHRIIGGEAEDEPRDPFEPKS
ncbi:MAG: trimeric intracellular cation channel family protein, partial [Eggerthellaceae bacterium]